jgi:hypothetical protein
VFTEYVFSNLLLMLLSIFLSLLEEISYYT